MMGRMGRKKFLRPPIRSSVIFYLLIPAAIRVALENATSRKIIGVTKGAREQLSCILRLQVLTLHIRSP